MDLDLPQHLEATRQTLASSLRLHPSECAPAAPRGMVEDLGRRFSSADPSAMAPKRSFHDRLMSFIATPAFGLSAMAVLLLGVFGPSLVEPTPPNNPSAPSSIRGGWDGSYETVQIALLKAPSGIRSLLETSGDFDNPDLICEIENLSSAEFIQGPKVIVDFPKSELYALDPDGTRFYTAPIPEATDELSMAIAKAVAQRPDPAE